MASIVKCLLQRKRGKHVFVFEIAVPYSPLPLTQLRPSIHSLDRSRYNHFLLLTAWIVSAVSLIFCIGACLSYSLCLGDVSSSLAQTFGWNGVWASRQFWIIMLTTIVLYPLCNLKSLIALAPFSFAGVTAVLITTVFIGWRCPMVNAKSPYSMQGGAQLLSTLSLQQLPKFQTMNKGFLNPSSLILFGMAASAYL